MVFLIGWKVFKFCLLGQSFSIVDQRVTLIYPIRLFPNLAKYLIHIIFYSFGGVIVDSLEAKESMSRWVV